MTDFKSYLVQLREDLFDYHPLDHVAIGSRWLDATFNELISGSLKNGAALYNSLISTGGWRPQTFNFAGSGPEGVLPVTLAVRNLAHPRVCDERSERLTYAERQQKNVQMDTLASAYYIPAGLLPDGSLQPGSWQWPWFDQAFLEPDGLAGFQIASLDKYQKYTQTRKLLLHQLSDWKQWIALAIELYQNVTGFSLTEAKIKDLEFGSNVYVVPDIKAYELAPLAAIYDNLNQKTQAGSLTARLLALETSENKKRRLPQDLTTSYIHSGHVSSREALYDTQRRVVEQMLALHDNGIMAVNSPLGTEPEQCVTAHLASKLINAAVLEEKPPLSIIVARDNHQIDSLSQALSFDAFDTKSDQEALALLGISWIEGLRGLNAVVVDDTAYDGSFGKNTLKIGNSTDMDLALIDNPASIKEMTENLITQCGRYFKEPLGTLDKCRKKLHETLVNVDFARQSMLQTTDKIQSFMRGNMLSQDILFFPEDELESIRNHRRNLAERLEQWRQHFKTLPLSLRIGSNSDMGKVKLKAYYEAFRNEEELSLLPAIESLEQVEKALALADQEQARQEVVLEEIVHQQDKTEHQIRKLGRMGLDIETIEKHISQPDKINNDLDTSLRVLAFWLAVHYYESRWLAGESIVLRHQRGRTDDHSAGRFWNRLSLITPCLIAQAGTYGKMKGLEAARLADIYVPDAQNWPLAEAVPLTASGRRLFVYGDPAASVLADFVTLDQKVSRPDRLLQSQLGTSAVSVNTDNDDFSDLPGFVSADAGGLGIGGGMIFGDDNKTQTEPVKLLPYPADLLTQAAERSDWFVWDRDGVWLADQLRNVEEIANYGSWLFFNDRLKSRRKALTAPMDMKMRQWSAVSLWQVDTHKAEKYGYQLHQPKEIEEIVRWVKSNFDSVKAACAGEFDIILAIAAPFAYQVRQLRRIIDRECHQQITSAIRIDLLDNFNSSDVYPVVLFSGIYGRNDGCELYEKDKSMLYRALSLASDFFLYFGDVQALPEKGKSPAAQFRKKLKALNRKK